MGKTMLMVLAALCALAAGADQKIRLTELDLATMTCGWPAPSKGKNLGGHPLQIGERTYTGGACPRPRN